MSTCICRKCAFWKPARAATPDSQPVWGECRRQPPRLQMSRLGDEQSAAWPPTEAGDFCGEWRPTNLPLPFEKENA